MRLNFIFALLGLLMIVSSSPPTSEKAMQKTQFIAALDPYSIDNGIVETVYSNPALQPQSIMLYANRDVPVETGYTAEAIPLARKAVFNENGRRTTYDYKFTGNRHCKARDKLTC